MTEPIGVVGRVSPVHDATEPATATAADDLADDDALAAPRSATFDTAVVAPGTRATAANALAFEDFYRRQRDHVGRALAITLRDRELASDAVDEAMARAYVHWPKVGALDNPGGWVYRVGLNWSRSIVRRSRRAAPIWVTNPTASGASMALDPDVDRALGELPVGQRAVVICRLLLGLSEAETATALRLRPGTVKSHLHRATRALHDVLDDPDERRHQRTDDNDHQRGEQP